MSRVRTHDPVSRRMQRGSAKAYGVEALHALEVLRLPSRMSTLSLRNDADTGIP